MTQDIAAVWDKAGLPTNEPEDLAKAIAILAAADRTVAGDILQREAVEEISGNPATSAAMELDHLPNSGAMDWDQVDRTAGLTGRAFYVEGGLCWDIEEGLDRTRHLWLGKRANDGVLGTQALIKKVGDRKRD